MEYGQKFGYTDRLIAYNTETTKEFTTKQHIVTADMLYDNGSGTFLAGIYLGACPRT